MEVKTLLTGGTGFVGLNIAEELLRIGQEVIILSDQGLAPFAQLKLERLPGKFHVVKVDVTDREAVHAVFRRSRPTHVIHAAVITAGQERESRDFDRIVDVNIKGTANVLRGALQCGTERVVYVSSGSVYGETLYGAHPLSERECVPIPDTLYSITKYSSERICARFRQVHGLNVICVRVGSVFGPWERDTGVRDTLSTPFQILRLALNGEQVRIARNEPRRDWIYSRDVAAGLIRIVNTPSLRYSIYNLGSGVRWVNVGAEWCSCLRAVFPGLQFRTVLPGETANVGFLGELDRATMCVERLTSDAGFQPAFDQSNAFADYLAWINENHRAFFQSGGGIRDDKK